MARRDFAQWVPEEPTSEVIERVQQRSVAESLFRSWPMASRTRSIPRSAGIGVDAMQIGDTYNEDTSTADDVILTAQKFGRAVRIAEEDLNDTLPDTLASIKRDWATSYAVAIDNATIATSGALNVASGRPFTSIYETLRASADNGYTAGANIVTVASSAGPTYSELSQVVGLVEDSAWWDEARMVVAASPAYREALREILDSNNRPIFVEGRDGTPDTLFGLPIRWTLGARISNAVSASPTGSKLLVVLNPDYAALGKRSGPESMVSNEVGFLTDEPVIKMRARRGFAHTIPQAAAALVW
ncbi:MAG: phage major capsid protein [Actinomyces sp.]|nr:MAG: phage major capsid protein [Actinomyces sp.]